MADVNTPDASVATNASNQTQYFNLPLFIATDKPSWLVDWNGAMNEIDNILNDIATASEGAVADVTTIQTQVNTLSTTVTSLNSIVETAVEDVAAMQTTVDSHDTRMDTIEGDLITQNNLIKALSTSVTTMQGTVASLNTAVETMQTTLAGYDTRIETAEDAAAAAQTAVAGIQTTVQGLSSTVSGHTSQISALDGRVTALENAPSGAGIPSLSDLGDMNLTHPSATSITASVNNFTTLYTATEDCYAILIGACRSVANVGNLSSYVEIRTDPANSAQLGLLFTKSIPTAITDSTGNPNIDFIFTKLSAGDTLQYKAYVDPTDSQFAGYVEYAIMTP